MPHTATAVDVIGVPSPMITEHQHLYVPDKSAPA